MPGEGIPVQHDHLVEIGMAVQQGKRSPFDDPGDERIRHVLPEEAQAGRVRATSPMRRA